MRCKYCDVEIEGEAIVCPLCHEKLEQDGSAQPPAYPPKARSGKRVHTHFTFTNIYVCVSAVIFLIALTVNLTLDPERKWFWLAALVCAYGYVLIRNTILSANSISVKILFQMICIIVLMIVSDIIFQHYSLMDNDKNWLTNYALPGIFIISEVVMFTFTCCLSVKRTSLPLECTFFSFTGFIPLIIYAAGAATKLIPSLVSGILAAVFILSCLIFARKEIKNEWQKKFHV